jgi:hypothetical protein
MNSIDARTLASLRDVFKDFDPHRLTQEIGSLGETWADQDAAASGYEESRKSVLAQLILEYAGGSRVGGDGRAKPVPFTQAEQQALADERYRAHLDMMVDARRQANTARVRYDMGKMKLELMRSLQATLRQEMNMAGGR